MVSAVERFTALMDHLDDVYGRDTKHLAYPCVISAYKISDQYGKYIAGKVQSDIAKDPGMIEYYLTSTLGDLLRGNDGE